MDEIKENIQLGVLFCFIIAFIIFSISIFAAGTPPSINSVTDTPDPLNQSQILFITANVTVVDLPIDKVWVEIDGNNYNLSQTYPVLPRDVLVFDGFTDLTTYNWTTYGGVLWSIVSNYADSTNGGGAVSYLELNVSTVGYKNISVSFYYDTDALDGGEYFNASYYNGTDWTNMLSVGGSTADFTLYLENISSDVNNNEDFKIQFTCLNNQNQEHCKVDTLNITGMQILPQELYNLSYNVTTLSGEQNYNVYANTTGAEVSNLSGTFTVNVEVVAISAVNHSGITNQSAVINWTTNIASNTSVDYGTTVALGTNSQTDDSVTLHSKTLTALSNNTLYYYNVTSCDAATCAVSGPHNFTTLQNLDETAPTWNETPANISVEVGSGFDYDINASDNVALDDYYISDIVNFTINADTGLLQNNSFLSLGTYWLNISVNDTRGNNLTTTVNITVIDTTSPSALFLYQTPSDINTFSIFSSKLNITHKVEDKGDINRSLVWLFYKTNSSLSETFIYTNGTSSSGFQLQTYALTNISSNWTFLLDDNSVYPATYNINDSIMRTTAHDKTSLNSRNTYLKIELLNVSNAKKYGIFEVMANTTGSNSLQVYYCNSSYTTGNPSTSTLCTNFYNLNPLTPYNHTHSGGNSAHMTIPFTMNLTTRTIGGIYVTPKSYFILRGQPGTNAWGVFYISQITRINAIQTSTDRGATWSNFAGTVDSHLHQYNGTDEFNYYLCVNDTKQNQNCTTIRRDLIELKGLPPISPDVYSPVVGLYRGNITINYTASLSPNSYQIKFYNVTLVDENETYIYNISSNNTLNLGYVFNSALVSDGKYFIKVGVSDNTSQEAYGLSANITIDNTPPAIANITSHNITNQSAIINWTTDTIANGTVNYGTTLALGTKLSNTSFLTYRAVSLISLANQTTYYYNVTSCDAIGNCNITGDLNFTTLANADLISPYFVQALTDRTVEYGQAFFYQVNGSDETALDSYSVNDTTRFTINSTGALQNNSLLPIGVFTINITINDTSSNQNSSVISVTIQDTTAPSWNETLTNKVIEYETAFYYDVNASDLNFNNYFINDTTRFIINSSTGVLTNNTLIPVGVYWLNISANDTYGNINSSIININITDVGVPTWNETPKNKTLEAGTEFDYDVNASDLFLDSYQINDTTNFKIDADTGYIENNTLLTLGTYWLNISANDTSNNMLSVVINITVIDTTIPSWNETPINKTISPGVSFAYDVNASDLFLDSYQINDTTNFKINSVTGLIENNTDLSATTYWLNISANDTSGNMLSVVINLTVIDEIPPTWNETPNNKTIEYGTEFDYDVNASDPFLDSYQINDTTNFKINSDTGYIENNTLLTLGTYWLNISVNDSSANIRSITINITVIDATVPTWNETPDNKSFEAGTEFDYDVNASDLFLDSYQINDTTNFKINTDTGYIENNTLLAPRTYWLNISANDTSRNILSVVINITVSDTTIPTWNETPRNKTLEAGTEFDYDVNASDLFLDSYQINDTTNFKINTDTGYIENNTLLTLGTYWLNISANDTSNNLLSNTINITVIDTTIPSWNETPINKTISPGVSFAYDVNASDLFLDSYQINDTTNFKINSVTGLIENNTDLSATTYWLNISANDTSGNMLSVVINLTVIDEMPPTWNETPNNKTVEYGTEFDYDVNASDPYIDSYQINDTTNFKINSDTGYIENNTLLTLGTYWLNISVNDSSANIRSVVINVTVTDMTVPTWNETPDNKSFEAGTEFDYDVNASDLFLDSYQINDTTNFKIDADTGYIENNTLLLPRTYWLNISANDTSTNILSVVINITVSDTTIPTWNETPRNKTLEAGTEFDYDVNASDLFLDSYQINDTTNFKIDADTGYIENNTLLTLGTYWLNISANDTSGNLLSLTINITVKDITLPKVFDLRPAANTNYSVEEIIQISANVTDNLAVSEVYANITLPNGTLQQLTLTNESGDRYSNSFTIPLLIGRYNVTFTANDTSNNINSTETTFFVSQDNVEPYITIISPEATTYNYTNISLNITANDSIALDKIWYEWNGTNVTYTSATVVNFTDNSEITLIAYANDTSNNINFTQVIFTVDTCTPNLTNGSISPWRNLTCTGNQMNQSRNYTEYDQNSCGEIANTTYYEYQLVGPDLANTSWGNWSNISCLSTKFMNQSRSLIEYDAYGCKDNRTITEHRATESCDYDTDGDGTGDSTDKLFYDESNVTTTGITSLNITVAGNSTNGTFAGVQPVIFYDSSTVIINFTHNFSLSVLDLRNITITKSANYVIVNISKQLQQNRKKSILLTDNSFIALCAKDAEIYSINQVSSSCTGANETILTLCLGNSTGYYANGLLCIDHGTTIEVLNLTHSAVLGTVASASTPPSATTGGGKGSWSDFIEWFFGEGPGCHDDSECDFTSGEVCRGGLCVKLFDIVIKQFDVYIKPGELFNFKYEALGIANISDDVAIEFWLEKNGTILTSGNDVIYIGAFDEKTKAASLLMPTTLSPGVYDFYVQLEHLDYSVKAHRMLEITKKEEKLVVEDTTEIITKGTWFIVITAILIIALSVIAVFFKKRR